MISDEKMGHIVHLMLTGIEKAKLAVFPQRDAAVREAKRVSLQFISVLNEAGDAARQRIRAQKNAPPELSPQWEVLYKKYFEEEQRKRGG